MKKTYFKKSLLFIALLLVVLIFPSFTSAQTITSIVINLAKIVSYVSAFIAVSFWIITGILFLTAQGDPSKLTKAKLALVGAIIGTAVGILAVAAPDIIGSAVLLGV